MRQKYTAAHWGSYQVNNSGDEVKLEPLDDDPNPSTIGNGWMSATTDNQLRITKPAIRKGWLENRQTSNRCNDTYVEVEWDVALDLAAKELTRVRQSFGNSSIYAGSYGWASTGRFHHAQSQLKRFLNTIGGFTSSKTTYSHGAAEVLLPHITGMSNRVFQDKMTSLELVAEHCEYLVCFGGISARTAQITSSGTSKHEVENWLEAARQNGLKVVNISPLRSDFSSDAGAQWLPIRPNTDAALMLAIAHTLITKNLYDEAFLTTYCHGWEAFKSYVMGKEDGIAKTPQWAEEITEISAEDTIKLTENMARYKTMISTTWAMQRADHGEQPIWLALTLAAMLGQIGKPGTGFSFGYGSTTPVGRSDKLISWPSVPQGKNPVDDFIPVAKITELLSSPGKLFKFDGGTYNMPEIKLVYWAGGNPFHHQQDLNKLNDAWAKPDTVIVHEQFWTSTARRADIVFPVTSSLERDDIMMNRRDPKLVWMERVYEPKIDAKSDHDILCGLAERLDVLDKFSEHKSVNEWLEQLWNDSQKVAKSEQFDLPSFEAFKNEGVFECPNSSETRIQFSDFIADPDANPLNTPSGKIEIYSDTFAKMDMQDCPPIPKWIEPIEWLGDEKNAPNALHLISGQPATRLHSQLDNGSESKSTKIKGREPAYLHTEFAQKMGIKSGDIILIHNKRGKCLCAAQLTDDIHPQSISLATGAWYDPQEIDGEIIEVHGNPNVLTIDKGCSELSQSNIAHTALVWVSKWEKPLPPIKVHSPPEIERGN